MEKRLSKKIRSFIQFGIKALDADLNKFDPCYPGLFS